MRTKKISFDLIVPKRTSGKVPVPEHLPSLHGIQIWVGRRNAGKSVAATSLIKRYMDCGAIERVILVSPTYQSNAHTFAPLKINPASDVIEPTKDAVQVIKQKLDEELKEWEAYQESKKAYAKFLREMQSSSSFAALNESEVAGWEQMGFLMRPTEEPKVKALSLYSSLSELSSLHPVKQHSCCIITASVFAGLDSARPQRARSGLNRPRTRGL